MLSNCKCNILDNNKMLTLIWIYSVKPIKTSNNNTLYINCINFSVDNFLRTKFSVHFVLFKDNFDNILIQYRMVQK